MNTMPATAQAFATQEIEQGWLPGTRVVERIRPLRGPDQPVTYRTTKSATGALPTAPDGEVDEALFTSIWPLTQGRRVVSTSQLREGSLVRASWKMRDGQQVVSEVELLQAAKARPDGHK